MVVITAAWGPAAFRGDVEERGLEKETNLEGVERERRGNQKNVELLKPNEKSV